MVALCAILIVGFMFIMISLKDITAELRYKNKLLEKQNEILKNK